MTDRSASVRRDASSTNGDSTLEATLRHLFGEQRRLRELLERTRAELDQVNRAVLQLQKEYCTDAAREEEYDRCLERVLGYDPRLNLADLQEARSSAEKLEDLIREIEKESDQATSRVVA